MTENKLSVFISLILRHKPDEFGVVLDDQGFCYLDDLLYAIHTKKHYEQVTIEHILEIARTDDKQRYEVVDGCIRARYGHSFKTLSYPEKIPPKILFHGTYEQVLSKILSEGIKKMGRKYVHLSETTHFATLAGKRRGEPVLLQVDTEKATVDGYKFYYAGNEVWLTDDLPAKYLTKK